MTFVKAMATFLGILVSVAGQAQTVTESWILTAGTACGGGLSAEVQGEVGSTILRRLKLTNIEGEGSLQISDAQRLLEQFKEDEKSEVYTAFTNCLITIMSAATATSQLPAREVVLNSNVAVASLTTVKRGQAFVMVPDQAVAIKDHSLLLSISEIRKRGERSYFYYSWSNSETGEEERRDDVYQSNLIQLGENCNVVPYEIDVEKQEVSFLSNC